MILLIPERVYNIRNIKQVVLEVGHIKTILHPETLKQKKICLHDDVYKKSPTVNFIVTNKKDKVIIISVKSSKLAPSAEIEKRKVSAFAFVPPHLMRVNTNSSFANDEEGKTQVLDMLDQKADCVEEGHKIKTGKNLIYYTLFDTGSDYVEMLSNSIKSLGCNESFDVLVFTDEATKSKIQKFLLGYPVMYKVIDTPIDGIEASKVKTKIYDFENINDYENILFLDADTVCIGNVMDIFSQSMEYNKLYTAYNSNLTIQFHTKSLYHGFLVATEADVEQLRINNQMPFNAGQFLFKNSSGMKQHFDNVNWFMQNWPGEYFFEQAFMNHYFCMNNLTDVNVLNKFVKLIPASNMMPPENDQMILHFIGPALDGKAKISHIENYRVKHNI